MKKLSLVAILILFGSFLLAQSGNQIIKHVIAKMTLQEKVRLLIGGNDVKFEGAYTDVTNKVPGAAGFTYPLRRLNLPSLILSDGPAGVRIEPIRNHDSSKTYYATGFPVATLLASTWDTALVYKVGDAFGNEVKEFGVDVILAPAMNIQRNPLDGRNFEYYSEDPVIAGNIAAALVNGIQSNGVGTSIKHFVANNVETDRTTLNEIISERALREIYLKGFEIAVKKAQPWTVMNSYNKINGIYTSENYDLNTTILRKEWGFKGLVMTDWGGGRHPVAQAKAGSDLLMPGTQNQFDEIMAALRNGSLSIDVIDNNVAKILGLILKSPSYKHYKYSEEPDLKAHAKISRLAASEGMILLKNEGNALPLQNNIRKVALLGDASYNTIANGTGSGEVHKPYVVSIFEGMKNSGYMIDNQSTTASVDALASKDDAAIITIGRNAGEGSDRPVDGDFTLKDSEREVIKKVSTAFHAKGKKVIVILNIGGAIEVASWRDNVDAILLAWQPGMEAGNAIADILSGKVNPSGKLAITFPMKYSDEPSAGNFPGTTFPKQARAAIFGSNSTNREVDYKEGIFVGYRYFNTFKVQPAYPFGFGLSYTHFNFSDLKLSDSSFHHHLTASVTVKNSGDVAGKEVVQLYISAPKGEEGLEKPEEELKAFAKTNLLKPGESQTIQFSITPNELASFVESHNAWIADKGVYTLRIGASSVDIRQQASFAVPSEIIVEKTHAIHYPKNIQDLQ
ncbi:glycoside hydrolase family 3 C-terminal domain-containing protein [Arachidicoccus soli]|uniref:Beta-glucosidase n=1 Tax=Arachidicoccus soli TaxID=2341117 RepID=A0A386HK52_9BACT|nr:glycoside hydrolase family 3 C-terminal domain-containing protein [Arachidicoccus soli]AYD46248.1 beta-glucosidase [Arachidicoccus soli]